VNNPTSEAAKNPPHPAPAAPDEALRAAGIALLEVVGAGSSSTVYRGHTLRRWRGVPQDTDVAVKVLRPELCADARAVEQLLREGELGLRVRSPHVARIFGFATAETGDPPLAYLVMEWVEGRTLRAFLAENGAVVEDLARRLGLDAASGLAALHRLGVVHRDLKPENLALTPDGQVKVVDLGLARTQDGRPSDGGFFGTVGYAAPEVLAGEPASAASDLYALGLVLFEAVTGRHPFHAATNADEMMHAHLHETPPRASHLQPRVSALLEWLIGELLQKDPAARPASAQIVAQVLRMGESSRAFGEHEKRAPILASRQRLRALRRFAPTPLFGRRAELRTLDRLTRELLAGRGNAVSVSGAYGIGRRRLLDEWLDSWLHEREDLVFLGGFADRGAEHGHGAPFPDILLDWFLRGDDASSPKARARLRARIRAETKLPARDAEHLADIACGVYGDDAPAARAEWLARGLLEIARPGRPVVVRVERADLLSDTGKLVVARLVESIADKPLLLVLVSIGPPLPGARTAIRVSGLAEQEFVEFGTALFESGEAPVFELREAHGVLGGSPGHLLASLEDLTQHDVLAGRPGSYRVIGEMPELHPPRPLLQRLREQIAQMPPATAFVFQTAAILGEGFPLRDLEALTGRSELEVLEALSAFRGRVIRVERGKAMFRHLDYRRALLDLIPAATRRRLHRTAAWILEERGAPALEVGLHYSRAAEHFSAVEPLLLGLDRMVRAGSRRAGRRIADRLRLHLEALPHDAKTDAWRLRHLLLDARAQQNDDRPRPAATAYWRAERLAAALGDPPARARARAGLAELALQDARFRRARRLADRAARVVEDRDDAESRSARAVAVSIGARAAAALGDIRGMVAVVRHALGALAPEDELRARLWIDIAVLLTLRARLLAASRALKRAQRSDPRGRSAVELQLARGMVMLELGERERAAAAFTAALDVAGQLGEPRAAAAASLGLGVVLDAGGTAAAATARYFDAYAGATAVRERVVRALAGLQLLRSGVAVDAGDAEHSEAPAVRVAFLLHRAENEDTDPRPHLDAAHELELAHALPLGLRLRVLHAAGEKLAAKDLADDVARRLPAGNARRRFLARAKEIEGAATV
jgi:tetratricopeptide (TPR) repeat protein